MKTKKLLLSLTIILLFIVGCTSNSRNVEVRYLKEGKLYTEKIPLDFIKDGQISSSYIDTLIFSILDSLSYPEYESRPLRKAYDTYRLEFFKKNRAVFA